MMMRQRQHAMMAMMRPIQTQFISQYYHSCSAKQVKRISSAISCTHVNNKYRNCAQQQSRHFGTVLGVINPRKLTSNNDDGGDDTREKNRRNKKKSKHRKQGGQSSYKFVDVARIKVLGGDGGKGCLSYESKYGSRYKKRPDGGHGGDGGYVVIVADANEQSLNMSTHHYKGQDGGNGTSREMHGRNGKEKIIRVPCGVVVKR